MYNYFSGLIMVDTIDYQAQSTDDNTFTHNKPIRLKEVCILTSGLSDIDINRDSFDNYSYRVLIDISRLPNDIKNFNVGDLFNDSILNRIKDIYNGRKELIGYELFIQ